MIEAAIPFAWKFQVDSQHLRLCTNIASPLWVGDLALLFMHVYASSSDMDRALPQR